MTTRRLLYETGRKSIGHELNSSRLAIADSLQLLYGGLVVCSVLVGQRRRRGLLVVSSQQIEASRKLSFAQFDEIVHRNHLACTNSVSVSASSSSRTSDMTWH